MQALGMNGREYYFLTAKGQYQMLLDKDIGRNAIIGLFGGDEYLREQWPKYARNGFTVINFDHGLMSPVLIMSCHDKGIWSPEDNVRGVGTWSEDRDDGESLLVMHCGDKLFVSDGLTSATGLRGKMLYPAAPAQPHPERARGGEGGPADVLLDKLKTWNWLRGELDAKLHLGWIGSAILGAAPDWRPIEWITGGSGTGKSTLMTLTRWTFGTRAMIKSEDATPAGIKHRVKDSSLPVSLDELESEGSNLRPRELVKLARIASSGGETIRGQPGGGSLSFIARNAFQFSSIVIPSLPQQDRNRMAILELDTVEWAGARRYEPGEDADELEEDDGVDDTVLGSRAEWERIGRQLRGRVLAEWHRYKKTFRAYRRALEKSGHNARGCDQFGALGAAYDCLRFEGFDQERALAWAKDLPAAAMAETTGYQATHEQCLKFLLGQSVEVWKGGARDTVASLLRQARADKEGGLSNTENSVKVLKGIGLKLYRDMRNRSAWWIAISNSHQALARFYRDTDWSGLPGAPGAWAQMMARIDGAMTKNDKGNPLRLRFEGLAGDYCVALPWEKVFPAMKKDEDDVSLVYEKDRDE